jgi:hypothetical protein
MSSLQRVCLIIYEVQINLHVDYPKYIIIFTASDDILNFM